MENKNNPLRGKSEKPELLSTQSDLPKYQSEKAKSVGNHSEPASESYTGFNVNMRWEDLADENDDDEDEEPVPFFSN